MNTLISTPEKSSPNLRHSSEVPPDEILRVLRRSRRNAHRVKNLFLADDLNSAEGLLIASFDSCLGRIEAGITVKFEDLLRLAECFNRDNLETVGE